MIETITKPISWQLYFILYFFIASLDTMIWPMIWCKQTLSIFGGIHILVEGFGLVRLLFNQSKLVQPICILSTISYLVAAIILPLNDSLKLFSIAFILTDSGSFIIGLYFFLFGDTGMTKIGLIFLIHGFTTMVFSPLLLTNDIFDADKLYPFIIIFLSGVPQLYIEYQMFYKSILGEDVQGKTIPGKTVTMLVAMWAIYATFIFLLFYFFSSNLADDNGNCGSHPETILFAQILFPIQGMIGLFIQLYFSKLYCQQQQQLTENKSSSSTFVEKKSKEEKEEKQEQQEKESKEENLFNQRQQKYLEQQKKLSAESIVLKIEK
jgi:hypothetical protein